MKNHEEWSAEVRKTSVLDDGKFDFFEDDTENDIFWSSFSREIKRKCATCIAICASVVVLLVIFL
ncbi:MAG: hypothetical protein P9L92_00930 [Candidatus Electryonea clarkiae]|nr:hypothetical protein [Candidatus Electryonea clarkiae]MDP8287794.1 hypothetical protein [Candidatus Electryonea clarkiae]